MKLGGNMIKKLIIMTCFFLGATLMLEGVTNQQKQELAFRAAFARNHSYAPYSKYCVGCSLITPDGRILTGSNVENASYGLTICAERAAIFGAVSQGIKDFVAIAVATEDGKGAPCGGCRQVIYEFNPNIKVFMCDKDGNITNEFPLSTLLPHAFGPKNLE